MLVLPGGGFEIVATDLEATEICDWVVQQGMACAVLKYRVPQAWPGGDRPTVELGLENTQRAIGLIRQQALSGRRPHIRSLRPKVLLAAAPQPLFNNLEYFCTTPLSASGM
jgi:hypothetical protein